MTVAVLDKIAATTSYIKLVNAFPPRKIRSAFMAKEVYSVIECLMDISNPSADQLEYLEMLSTIVENYEAETFPTPSIKIGDLLAHLLESKGISQAALASQTGIPKSIISEAISGKRRLSIANIKTISKYLKVDSGLLVDCVDA